MRVPLLMVVLLCSFLACAVTPLACLAPAENEEREIAHAVPVRLFVSGNSVRPLWGSELHPKYPREAKEKSQSGTVRVQIVVDCDGKVIEANVLRGDPLLAKVATAAIRKWRYAPTLLNGEAIQVWMVANFSFNPL